ncbi:MAG: invasion associated locus B family protein [Rhodospirillaceae bacterium]|jgi:hypothetical protein|nr:invasion associated locus B family protein [Rhodospirillaceae bacterium]
MIYVNYYFGKDIVIAMFAVRIVVFAFLISIVNPVFANNTKILSKSGSWESFVYINKTGKVCYTVSLPKGNSNFSKGRNNETYISITHRPNNKSFDVINITHGSAFKKTEPVKIDINGTKFDLYTSTNGAWAYDDKAVVQALLKGKTLVVHGNLINGTVINDTYSLDGLVKAYNDISKACAVK